MIDFRRTPLPDPLDRMVEQIRTASDDDRGGVLVRALEYMSLRDVDQRELVARLCRMDGSDVATFLDTCLDTKRSDALALAEGVLAERGLAGLEAWIDATLRRPRGARWLVDALSDVADPHATRVLLGLLDHGQSSLRRRAADGLAGHRGHLDLRAFVRFLAEPLTRGVMSPDPFAAVRALHRLADPALEPDFGQDAAKRAERVLINCVRHETRGGVRGDAIAALGEIGSRRAVGCLVDALHREDEHHHRDVVIALRKIHPDRALIALLGLLQSRDPIIREEAANALGEIGDPKAVRRLRELLRDPNPDVRQEAVLALGKLGGPSVLDALEDALADEDAAVRAMACHALAEGIGLDAQGKLIRALYDGSADVRAEAAYLLGDIGDQVAEPHLEAASGDPSRDAFGDPVGRTARRSLGRIRFLRARRERGED